MDTTDWQACTLWGAMGSDSTDEQYPQRNVCGACIAEDEKRGEDAQIVSINGDYDDSLGPECGLECGMSADDED
ncbi:hypothetical protein V3391_00930 [Luteimonas sp. SMYT11W]|uniref:Uncharacterized protein n=1 Tax=Luteimonas flava TaxID=3115822 RepID=A0ABU7W9X7_9GAMM